MKNYNFVTACFVVCVLLGFHLVNSRVAHTDESGSFIKTKDVNNTKTKDQSWLQIADEYMNNFVNGFITSKNNETSETSNGFFSDFVGGIINTSTELAQKNGTNKYYGGGKMKTKDKNNDKINGKKDSWYTNWMNRFS